MLSTLQRKFRNDDVAVSAVIGTILMIAATVILGGAIYAATSGFGQKETAPKEDLVFKATATDTDGNQLTDGIRITYLSGPELDGLSINVSKADGSTITGWYTGNGASGQTTVPVDDWAPGDFIVVLKASGSTGAPLDTGNYIVTLAFNGNTVLDTTVKVG